MPVCDSNSPRFCCLPLSLLAESMLPEGAHLRESDWTVSFLSNQLLTQAHADLIKEKEKALARMEKAAAEGNPVAPDKIDPLISVVVSEVELQDGQGSLCVLNLVRTKMDKTVKRGAIVKALAIATRHRFYNIFKPLLMLCLDQIFDSPNPEDQVQLLSNLYMTVNNMPLDSMPSLSPLARRVQRASRLRTAMNPPAADFFITTVKWGAGSAAGHAAPAASGSASPAAAGGASNSLSSSAPLPSGPAAPVSSSSSSVASLPMRIPLCMEADEVLEASLTTLVNRFQEGIMDIYTAILAEKRVIFLGYQQPAALCCDCVLSACLLVSPPLVGTLSRAYPYANLTNMEFLAQPGFVAGVTNPIFESRPGVWWDLLANISNGTVTLSKEYAEELVAGGGNPYATAQTTGMGSERGGSISGSGGSASGGGGSSSSSSSSSDRVLIRGGGISSSPLRPLDQAFFLELMGGMAVKLGEEWVRCAFRDLTSHVLGLAEAVEPFHLFDDAGNSWRTFHLQSHAYRIQAVARSKQALAWRNAKALFATGEGPGGSALREMDAIVRHHVRTLQVLSACGPVRAAMPAGAAATSAASASTAELLVLYTDLEQHVRTREELLELLAMLPESQGGLTPVALGLLHRHPRVRACTVQILQRIDAFSEGNKAVSALNYFLLITYYRLVKQCGAQMHEGHSDEEGAYEEEHAAQTRQHQQQQQQQSQSWGKKNPPATPHGPRRLMLHSSTHAAGGGGGVMASPSSELGSIPIGATPMAGGSYSAATTPASATHAAGQGQGAPHHHSSQSNAAILAARAHRYQQQQLQHLSSVGESPRTPASGFQTGGGGGGLTIRTVTPAGTDHLLSDGSNYSFPIAAAADHSGSSSPELSSISATSRGGRGGPLTAMHSTRSILSNSSARGVATGSMTTAAAATLASGVKATPVSSTLQQPTAAQSVSLISSDDEYSRSGSPIAELRVVTEDSMPVMFSSSSTAAGGAQQQQSSQSQSPQTVEDMASARVPKFHDEAIASPNSADEEEEINRTVRFSTVQK